MQQPLRTVRHSDTQTLRHSDTQMLRRPNSLTLRQMPRHQPFRHSDTQRLCQPDTQTLSHLNTQTLRHSVTQNLIPELYDRASPRGRQKGNQGCGSAGPPGGQYVNRDWEYGNRGCSRASFLGRNMGIRVAATRTPRETIRESGLRLREHFEGSIWESCSDTQTRRHLDTQTFRQ